jgi:deoxyribodipyrimidine photolyase
MDEVGSTFRARHATVVLFTRDLRVHDHPALVAACRAGAPVLPLFVLDDAILNGPFAAPNRVRFLLDCLHDLRAALVDHQRPRTFHRASARSNG